MNAERLYEISVDGNLTFSEIIIHREDLDDIENDGEGEKLAV